VIFLFGEKNRKNFMGVLVVIGQRRSKQKKKLFSNIDMYGSPAPRGAHVTRHVAERLQVIDAKLAVPRKRVADAEEKEAQARAKVEAAEQVTDGAKNELLNKMKLVASDLAADNWTYQGAWLAAHLHWQFSTREDLKREATPESACRFALSPLKTVEFREHTSSSATITGFAQIPAHQELLEAVLPEDRDAFDRVSLKISFPRYSVDSASDLDGMLDFEREVIYTTFSQLLDNLWCPHVVAPLVDWHCRAHRLHVSDDATDRTEVLFESVLRKMEREHASSPSPINVNKQGGAHTLVMERGTDVFSSLLRSMNPSWTPGVQRIPGATMSPPTTRLSDDEFYGLFFQCYYALSCFARLGIRHNDLHMRNILYRKLAAPEDLYYEVHMGGAGTPPRLFHLRTRYILKFFDMDHGSVYAPHVQRNTALDMYFCERAGECSGLYSVGDVAGFTLGALYMLATGASPDKGRHWHDPVMRTRIANLTDAVFYSPAFTRFGWNRRSREDSHHWRYEATQLSQQADLDDTTTRQAYERMLDNTSKTAEECMSALFTHGLLRFEPAGARPPSSYPVPKPFHLPPQVVIHLRRPRLTSLAPDEISRYRKKGAVKYLPALEPDGLALDRERMSNIIEFTHNMHWNRAFSRWRQELVEDRVPSSRWEWPDAAYTLWLAFQPDRVKPSVRECLFRSCLTLTCPMFYGMSREFRRFFRAEVGGAKFSEDDMIAAESCIWEKFAGRLPVKIPFLYNLGLVSTEDEEDAEEDVAEKNVAEEDVAEKNVAEEDADGVKNTGEDADVDDADDFPDTLVAPTLVGPAPARVGRAPAQIIRVGHPAPAQIIRVGHPAPALVRAPAQIIRVGRPAPALVRAPAPAPAQVVRVVPTPMYVPGMNDANEPVEQIRRSNRIQNIRLSYR